MSTVLAETVPRDILGMKLRLTNQKKGITTSVVMPLLILSRQGEQLLRFPIEQERIVVGRDPECDIPLADPNVSRHHFELEWDGTAFQLTDFSRNGTYVDGERVTDTVPIDSGQQIEVSDYRITFSTTSEPLTETTISQEHQPTLVLKYEPKKKELTCERVLLTAVLPHGERTECVIDRLPISIGAAPHNTVRIAGDPYISRTHCRIESTAQGLLLRNCGSLNGTWWGGHNIQTKLLPERGTFQIGKTNITYHVQVIHETIGPAMQQRCGEMLGRSRSMQEIFALVQRVAPSDVTVCISGESGTGKELLAHALHAGSGRATKPLVAINCGAIPQTIIESELFGHERGAFTGATAQHRGVFEQADGGTLFLDEIGEMPLDLQIRLLRVLETRTVRRVGGTADIPVDCRIVAATNQDLSQRIQQKLFREDLFYRLYIVPLYIPPLRERIEDLELLAHHFLQAAKPPSRTLAFSPEALLALSQHSWPGNIRELRHTIERAVLTAQGPLIESNALHFAPQPAHPSTFQATPAYQATAAGPLLQVQERRTIEETLRAYRGNISKASKALGIARSTLTARVKKWEIDLKDIRSARCAASRSETLR
ncbi:MAG: sigma 54-interacting transcriptional regulator [Deltaproteobacteria bacterium]|nr:sigma 54-interacting transcriptional regulator [Deltaproteobacteria bacterium]